MKTVKCTLCEGSTVEKGYATQVYRRTDTVETVAGIPAVRICPRCQNAVLEWQIAQQVEDLVMPLFSWQEKHTLPAPIITVVFPTSQEAGRLESHVLQPGEQGCLHLLNNWGHEEYYPEFPKDVPF